MSSVKIKDMFSKLKLKINHSKIDCKLHLPDYVQAGIANWKLLLFLFFIILSSIFYLPSSAQAAMVVNSSGVSNNLKSGLVGWWTFDGGDMTSTIAFDKSGSGNTGILTGTKKIQGKIGQGLNFNGTSDLVSATVIAPLAVTYWYKASNGAWTFNASSTNITYVNGQVSALVQNPILIEGGTVQIGNIGSIATPVYFSGSIDDVRIYNRALSANEIYSLYQYGNAKINVNSAGVGKDKLTNGLVGWWTFDGGDMTSTVAFDKSGNGKTGTLSGTGNKKVAGKIGQGLGFNGTNDQFTVGSLGSFPTKGTLTFWFNPGNVINYQNVLHTEVSTSCTAGGGNQGIRLEMYSTGQMSAVIGTDTAACASGFTSTSITNGLTTIKQNRWQMFTITWDTSTNKLSGYIDGIKYVSDASMSTWPTTIDNFHLGTGFDARADRWYKGSIDDLRVYSVSLTADEVYSLYQYGNAKINVSSQAVANQGTKSGLVGHWTFNGADCGATWCVDKSGNGFTGTLTSVSKTTGKVGQALLFNTASKVDAGSSATLRPTTAFTLNAWVFNKAYVAGVFPRIMSNLTYTDSTHNAGIELLSQQPGAAAGYEDRPYLQICNNTCVAAYTASPYKLPLNKWTMVTGTYDNATMKIYINGQFSASNAVANGVGITTNNMNIGAWPVNSSNGFTGKIDEARVYNRALSANEIYSLYMYGK